MNKLATNPRSDSAKATIRKAASALRHAGKHAPHKQRLALNSAAAALHALAVHGLSRASSAERALVRAGHLLEHSCAFPVS